MSAEWEEAFSNLRETLKLPADEPVPPIPRTSKPTPKSPSTQSIGLPDSKRKAPDEDGDEPMDDSGDSSEKRTKTTSAETSIVPTAPPHTTTLLPEDMALRSAQAAAAFIPFLSPEELLPPKLPNKSEMEGMLLELRKKALLNEYFDD